jgi:hypothetical protein
MSQSITPTVEAAAVRMMLELGIPPKDVAEMTIDARQRHESMTCEWRAALYGQSEPCESCGAERWHACRPVVAQQTGDHR